MHDCMHAHLISPKQDVEQWSQTTFLAANETWENFYELRVMSMTLQYKFTTKERKTEKKNILARSHEILNKRKFRCMWVISTFTNNSKTPSSESTTNLIV